MGHVLDYVLPAVAFVAGNAIVPGSGAYLAAATSGVDSYAHNHNIGGALGNAAGSFIGSNIGGSLFPGGAPGIGTTGANTIGSALGTGSSSDIASALGGGGFGSAVGGLAGQGLGSVGGAGLGGMLGTALGSQLTPPPGQKPPSPYVPTQAGQAALPSSLNSMSSLTPQQQSTGLATQGLYGGGLGPQEQAYFGNSINRQLVNPQGQVSPISSLPSVDNTYLNQLGFNTSNPNNLLEALSKWTPS